MRRERVFPALGLAALLLLALPPLAVDLTPIADLPQQLAQIPLLLDTLGGRAPDLEVQWLAPNKLCYPLLGLAWLALPPLAAGRAALVLVAAVWVASIFWLAARRRRPASHALLAAPLLYNHVLGFGFFNFVLGLAAFCLWIEITERALEPVSPARLAAETIFGSLLLYWSHALWLGAGLVWLLVAWLTERPPRSARRVQAASVLPSLLLVLTWYPEFQASDWQSSSDYGPWLWERLLPAAWPTTTLGAVHGPLEPAFLLLLALWLATGLWQHREGETGGVDRRLLLAGLLLAAAALLLPEKIDRTIRFASRWQPMAAVLLLLALPAPRWRPLPRRGAALAAVALFAAVTTATWVGFERHELRGLRQALAALPPGQRLVGLEFYRSSPRFRYPPFLQTFAYARLVADADLSFSFVDLASSLVVRREIGAERPWTRYLEWFPDDLQPGDLDYFDYALVHAPPERRAALVASFPRLVPVTGDDRWRLFRIAAGAASPRDDE